jgi:hypothetical protein
MRWSMMTQGTGKLLPTTECQPHSSLLTMAAPLPYPPFPGYYRTNLSSLFHQSLLEIPTRKSNSDLQCYNKGTIQDPTAITSYLPQAPTLP